MSKEILSKFWNDKKRVVDFATQEPSQYLVGFFSKISNPKDKKVLDIGCGGGRNTEMLLRLGFDIFALDLHKKMVESTRKKIAKMNKKEAEKIILASVLSLPYPDSFFDYVVSNGLFHNAENLREFKLSVRETSRVLKKNGCLVLNTFVDGNFKNGFAKSQKEKYLYFTRECLPIVLLPTPELINIFSENSLKLLSSQEKPVTISTGERKVFRAIFLKK